MDSLTTAYLVCMLIGSASAVVGALAGNKLVPIESSEIVLPVESVAISPPEVVSAEPVPPPQNTAQTAPEVSSEAQ